MMRFRAVESGLKLFHCFPLHLHPGDSAASPATHRPSSHHQKPPSDISLHGSLPTIGGYITGKTKHFITELYTMVRIIFVVSLIITFFKVCVFQGFPWAVSALAQASSRDAPRRTEMGWQWGIKSELAPTRVNFFSLKITRSDPSVLACFLLPRTKIL